MPYYSNTDYYYCSGVKQQIYANTKIKKVLNKEVYDFAKAFKIPVSHTSIVKDGREIIIGIYPKYAIDNLFTTDEKKKKVEDYFNQTRAAQSTAIATKIKATKKTAEQKKAKNEDPQQLSFDFDRQEENREKMNKFIAAHEEIPTRGDETDMKYVSDELLRNDGVFYESAQGDENISDVETHWSPREGLFLEKDPKRIASYLRRHSKDKAQAMRRLTFYMNRAGEELKNRTVLEQAKKILSNKIK